MKEILMSELLLKIYRFIYLLHQKRLFLLAKILNIFLIRIPFGCRIGEGAKIGRGCTLGYGGIGIVIHHRVVIGNNVHVATGVTIGGTSKKYEVPVIGSNCLIGTGAKILGPVKIGNNCVIGANAVVLRDIPDNCMAAGVPASIKKRDIDINNYI